jgi:hypothetical protein
MPVGERVGFDHDPVADDALDGEAAAVDLRRDALDHGAAAPVPDDGADVGQWGAADRVLLGMDAENAAIAGSRTNVGWVLRNRRRDARNVSNHIAHSGPGSPRRESVSPWPARHGLTRAAPLEGTAASLFA